MRIHKVWLIQDSFRVGDKVIYSINSKNLKDIFSNEKFSLKLLCKELSMSLPTLKNILIILNYLKKNKLINFVNYWVCQKKN